MASALESLASIARRSHIVPLWSDDLSGRSLEELLRAAIENGAWSQSLRLGTIKLVNSRLAKQISLEEYMVGRRIANDDAAECKRRKLILESEIRSRKGVRSRLA
jgi:hypothetical protein